jgi:prepilin-type processing-associated H-X9-DG protein
MTESGDRVYPHQEAMPLEYARPTSAGARRGFRLPITLVVLFILGGLAWIASFPADRGAREQANRVKCASNMRQIAEAISAYASSHVGRFPDDLETVLVDADLPPNEFICPSSKDTPAPTAAAPQATAAGFRRPGHCSYVYIGKGLTTDMTTPDMIVMFEPLRDHHGDGMNVIFADFHVEWFSKRDGQAILNRVASGVRPVHDPTTAPATAPAAGQGN